MVRTYKRYCIVNGEGGVGCRSWSWHFVPMKEIKATNSPKLYRSPGLAANAYIAGNGGVYDKSTGEIKLSCGSVFVKEVVVTYDYRF
jgi:hypothetical protein